MLRVEKKIYGKSDKFLQTGYHYIINFDLKYLSNTMEVLRDSYEDIRRIQELRAWKEAKKYDII
jgi:hypothetical protein